MNKKLLILIISLLFIPCTALAEDCTTDQIDRYKKLANEIQTTFDYVEDSEGVKFNINFYNVYKELYLVDYKTFDSLAIYKNNNNPIIAQGYAPGKTYSLSVLNDGSTCKQTIITRISITTPNYNKYYNDPLCEGIETYFYCQKWVNIGSVSYEEFKKNVNNYIKQQEPTKTDDDNKPEDNTVNRVRSFVANNYIYITLGVVLIALIIVIIYKRKKKYDW